MPEASLPQRARTAPPLGTDHVSVRLQEDIQEIINGIALFGALNAFRELGIADILAATEEKTLPVTELAEQCGAISNLLERILLPLAAEGFVTLTMTGVTLTERGAALCRDVPGSMWPAVAWAATAVGWGAVPTLAQVARTGRPVLPGGKGSLYEYLADHPKQRATFDEFMAARSYPAAAALAAQDFSDVHTVVDVGGGIGMMLGTILQAHPHLTGILQELPPVAEHAQAAMAAREMADRWQVLAADFFDGIPGIPAMDQAPGKGIYLAGSVVHNLNDDDALRFLARVRTATAMSKCPTELWLVEKLTLNAHLDLTMLKFFGDGQERTSGQYADLLSKAGFALQRNNPLAGGLNLMVATPR